MKRALFSLSLVLSLCFASMAQNSLFVAGYVVDNQGIAVNNHPVTVGDSLTGTFVTVNTNANGWYSTVLATGTVAAIILHTPDCNGTVMSFIQLVQVVPNDTFTHNFTYCSNTFPPNCTSSIMATVATTPNYYVTFTGFHNFAANVFAWDFGDGNTSTQSTPSHIYAGPGTYTVTLNASGPSSNPAGPFCTTTTTYALVITSNPTALCQANFVIDTVNSLPGTIIVWNTSALPNVFGTASYLWSFGDGNTSTAQLPTHTYAGPGVYELCLTLVVSTPGAITCTSVHCDTLEVDSAGNLIYKGFAGAQLVVLEPESFGTEEDEVNFVMYPNPAREMVKLEMQSNMSQSTIRVFNVLGMEVRNISVGELMQGQIVELPVGDLAPGNYWLSIESNKGVRTERFLKQ
jgi:PKD repeat protein